MGQKQKKYTQLKHQTKKTDSSQKKKHNNNESQGS